MRLFKIGKIGHDEANPPSRHFFERRQRLSASFCLSARRLCTSSHHMGSFLFRCLIVTALLFLASLDGSANQAKSFCGGIVVMAFASSPETSNRMSGQHHQTGTTGAGESEDFNDNDGGSKGQESSSSSLPLLPPPNKNREEGSIRSIKLGESISFEEFGPIILNTDGTTRRIDNWDTLTEHEKAVSWRRISKRNEQRRKALLKQMEEAKEDAGMKQGGEL
jgi:hypothetical protein